MDDVMLYYLPKAFAMPTLDTIDISGMKIIPVCSSDIISPKVIVLLSFSTVNGGGEISGNPPGTLPIIKNHTANFFVQLRCIITHL